MAVVFLGEWLHVVDLMSNQMMESPKLRKVLLMVPRQRYPGV